MSEPDAEKSEDLSKYELHDASLDFHDEATEHPDERWLVSYADMMTLLFGLFVMLYSMANKFDQVQKSTAKEFSKPTAVTPAEPKVEITAKELAELRNAQTQLDEERKKNELEHKDNQIKIEELNMQLKTQSKELDTTKLNLNQTQKTNTELTKLQADVQILKTENQDLKTKIENADLKNKKVLAQLQQTKKVAKQQDDSKKTVEQLQSEKESLDEKLREQTQSQEDLKKQLQAQIIERDNLQKQLQAQMLDRDTLNNKVKSLEQQLAKANAGAYAAVVITWPTQNHDIDLIVTDPEGRAYNYKHRSFQDHPGKFVLDTRRGPGAEMWQTEKLLPGIYQIKYVFYNTYGNNDPAPVFGSVYSKGGIFELPKVELKFGSKREQLYKIKISDKGDVQLVP